MQMPFSAYSISQLSAHVPDGRINGSIIGKSRDTLGVHVGNGLAVSQSTRFQSCGIHGRTHLQHGIDRLEHLQRRLGGELALDVGGPVDFFQEGIRLLGQHLCCVVDLVRESRRCAQHAQCPCSCGRHAASWASRPRHEGWEAAEANSHGQDRNHAHSLRHSLPSGVPEPAL